MSREDNDAADESRARDEQQQFPARESKVGEFKIATQDKHGRTTVIEGWLAPMDGKRTGECVSAQKLACAGLEGRTGSDGEQLEFDGGHLIPHSHGGPGDVSNMVAMERRANRSLVSASENLCRPYLESGQKLYLRVSVVYADNDTRLARTVTHEYFVEEGGEMRRLPNGHITTRTDHRMGVTMANAVGAYTQGQKIRDFQSNDPRAGVVFSEYEIADAARERERRVESPPARQTSASTSLDPPPRDSKPEPGGPPPPSSKKDRSR